MSEISDKIAQRKALLQKARENNAQQVTKNIKADAAYEADRLERTKREVEKLAGFEAKEYDQEVIAAQKAAELAKLNEQELARRVLARRSLLAFILRFEPQYEAGWVHKLICEKLERFYRDVQNKKSPRLMLFLPPRAGKSLIASQYFPAWVMGLDPKMEFISTSYSSQLSQGFSRKARGLLREKNYQTLFPKTRLDDSTQSVEHWMTTSKGSYVSAGVGGGITGKGCNFLIIDDPTRNQDDASSFTNREMQKGWYESTAYTRLAPGAGILVIMTRWHLDDLAGWLETKSEDESGDKFEIIRFPAIANEDEGFRKKGEALHPERYDIAAFDRIKRAVGPRTWAALYQQNPAPDDGIYFNRRDFVYYDYLPPRETLRFYSSWDLAIGEKEVNDFTVGIIWAVDPEENIYIVNYVRGHYGSATIIEKIIDTAVLHKCDTVTIEKGQILMALGPALNKSIQQKKAYSFTVYPMAPGKRDKMVRARSIQARMEQGMVKFPRGFENEPPFIEMLHFPSAKHDDFVDAMAYIGLYLEEAVPGTLPTIPKNKSWRDNLAKYMSYSPSSSTSSMAG